MEEQQLMKLVDKLSSENSEVRQEVVVTLVQMGELAVPLLREVLKTADKQVRLEIIQIFVQLGEKAVTAIPELRIALQDKMWEIRSEAAWVFVAMGEKALEAVPDLIKALNDKHTRVRSAAAWALGGMDPKAAVITPILTSKIKLEKDKEVIFHLARSLANLEGKHSYGMIQLQEMFEKKELLGWQINEYERLKQKFFIQQLLEETDDSIQTINDLAALLEDSERKQKLLKEIAKLNKQSKKLKTELEKVNEQSSIGVYTLSRYDQC